MHIYMDLYVYVCPFQATDDMVVELHSTRLDLNSTRLALEDATLKLQQAEVLMIVCIHKYSTKCYDNRAQML